MKWPVDIAPLKKRLHNVNMEPLKAGIARDNPGREHLFQLLRDIKWFILISILLSVLLYAPDQISELYRYTYASVCWNWHPKWFFSELEPCSDVGLVVASFLRLAWFYLTIFLIGALIWFGANQVAAESVFRMPKHSASINTWSLRLPAILGALPLIACAFGQLSSIPESIEAEAPSEGDKAIGDSAQAKAEMWADSVTAGLILGSVVTGLIGVGFGWTAYRLAKEINVYAREANAPYFYNKRFLLLTILFFIVVTGAFVIWPVPLPQLLTVFGILALFTLCLVAFCLYFSLLTIEYRLPVISGLLVAAFVLSLLDWNDNHVIRVLVAQKDAGGSRPTAKTAAEEFERWYENRPNIAAYDEYPVYIVAAQGGGMYAAYQTAVFLARLQDNCPAFRNHLFAISSVSGGSVGAATFISALRLAEAARARAFQTAGAPKIGLPDPCPGITEYFRSLQQRSEDNRKKQEESQEKVAETDEGVGELEKIVRKTLGTDLLSPLVAATLFPDFGQRFLPFPVPAFDRARALELAFEAATSELDPQDKVRPFAESFLSHWKPSGSTPALVMNATDAGSGRRVLISPFELHARDATTGGGTIMQFPFYPKEETRSKPIQLGSVLDIALSTAAGISARFPWLTPAATIDVSDGRIGSKHKKVRLVDGGYVDNSGVETVLDLIQAISEVKAKIERNAAAKMTFADGKFPYRPVQINVIALSGGTYSERSSFALGETMEPIRGLLSARASRAYVAIDRAGFAFPAREVETRGRDGAVRKVQISGLRLASLKNYSYEMPLGWVLSKRTREIIEEQSGRFDACEPNERFMQSSNKVPESDCIHLLTYHTLNRSLGAKLEDISDIKRVQGYDDRTQGQYSREAQARFNEKAATGGRFDQAKLIGCYRGKGAKSITPAQASSLQELLKIWEGHPEWADDRLLAFMLGSLAYDTGDFNAQIENLSYRSAQRISDVWPKIFPTPESANAFVNNPEALANKVYGNRLGNAQEGDGFRYRGRGLVQLAGRDNYRKYGDLIGVALEDNPDLILRHDIGAKVAFAQFFPRDKVDLLAPFFSERKEDWEGARRAVAGGSMGVDGVTTKSKAFLQCIKEATRKPAS